MKTKKIFMIPALALLFAGCQDDDMGGGTTTGQPATGEEVSFTLSLEDVATRTVYGEKTDNAYPIYWSTSGDQVIIASPDCKASEGGNPVDTYNVTGTGTSAYASSFTAASGGVKWGETSPATFYSVYPASKADFNTSNYSTVTLDMPTTQTCSVTNSGASPDMSACFMYAKTGDVVAGENTTVNLRYIPISTAIRFTLKGPYIGTAIIESVTLTAPTSIAGTFSINLANADGSGVPSMSATSGSTSITVKVTDSSGNNLALGENETAEVCVFLLLTGNTSVNSNWTITVNMAGGQTSTTLSLSSGTLTSGQVNNLGELPQLGSSNTYFISNAAELIAWNQAAASNSSTNGIVVADIDLTSYPYTWAQIGLGTITSPNQYTGTFDGGGHTITGLTAGSSSTNDVGLISGIGEGGRVRNLTLKNVSITGNYYVGGVAGSNAGGTVTNCSVSGTVTGSSCVGGVVGYNTASLISSPTSSASVTGCSVSVTVTGSSNVGGVVGYNYSFYGTYYSTVTDCYSTGSVTGSSYVGGVVGTNSYYSTVTACYSTGNVTGSSNVGGVVGYNYSRSIVTACYSLGNVSGSNYVGGVVGRDYVAGYTGNSVVGCYHFTGTISRATNTAFFGGVVGYFYESSGGVTACYWRSGSGPTNGIGLYSRTTGSDTGAAPISSWSESYVSTMNSAISTSGWKYVYNGSSTPPTLEKIE